MPGEDDLQPVDGRAQDPIIAVHKLLRGHGVGGPLKSRRAGDGGVFVWRRNGGLPVSDTMAALRAEGYAARPADDPPDAADGPTVYVEASRG